MFSGIPTHRPGPNPIPPAFTAKTVYWVVNNICREYSEAFPERPRFKPHGLRRKAITTLAMLTGNVDLTAQALGLNPSTARAHYLDAKAAFDGDAAMKLLWADPLAGEDKSRMNPGETGLDG